MYEQNVLLRSYKSFKHTFNHALLESKISGTISFAQWWVLDLTLETLACARARDTVHLEVRARSARAASHLYEPV